MKYENQYKAIVEKISFCQNNIQRRCLYSELELLRYEIEEDSTHNTKRDEIIQNISTSLGQLALVPVRRSTLSLLYSIEVWVRALGVSSSFILTGVFCSLPIIFLRTIDKLLQVDPLSYTSEYVKRCIAQLFLLQSGIDMEVLGLNKELFQRSSVLLTYTHASNLDGFFLVASCPVQQFAPAKKELFMVPFFSWLSLAIGGIPLDRKHRDRAIQALQHSVESAKHSHLCIEIAPEGTRSTTGQLLPFKKGSYLVIQYQPMVISSYAVYTGVFYMWKQLKAPIIPVVIYGAFDLYPVWSWVNQTGRMAIRYLDPIPFPVDENKQDIEHMMKLVRKRMLISLRDECPSYIGEGISYSYWLFSYLLNLFIISLNIFIWWNFHQMIVTLSHDFHLSISWLYLGLIFLILSITFLLYIYYVYVIYAFQPKIKTN